MDKDWWKLFFLGAPIGAVLALIGAVVWTGLVFAAMWVARMFGLF